VDGISARRERRLDPEKVYYEYEDLTDRRVLDGDAVFAGLLADPSAHPRLPPAPAPHLVGRAVRDLPVASGPPGAQVANLDAFEQVRPAEGTVPALVYGTVPEQVPLGALLAVAINGRVGVVVPVVAGADGARRFAGLIADETRFRPGANEVALYQIGDGGHTLLRLPIER
jgi:hypothetical protein